MFQGTDTNLLGCFENTVDDELAVHCRQLNAELQWKSQDDGSISAG